MTSFPAHLTTDHPLTVSMVIDGFKVEFEAVIHHVEIREPAHHRPDWQPYVINFNGKSTGEVRVTVPGAERLTGEQHAALMTKLVRKFNF
jgi:hypothetical protein